MNAVNSGVVINGGDGGQRSPGARVRVGIWSSGKDTSFTSVVTCCPQSRIDRPEPMDDKIIYRP